MLCKYPSSSPTRLLSLSSFWEKSRHCSEGHQHPSGPLGGEPRGAAGSYLWLCSFLHLARRGSGNPWARCKWGPWSPPLGLWSGCPPLAHLSGTGGEGGFCAQKQRSSINGLILQHAAAWDWGLQIRVCRSTPDWVARNCGGSIGWLGYIDRLSFRKPFPIPWPSLTPLSLNLQWTCGPYSVRLWHRSVSLSLAFLSRLSACRLWLIAIMRIRKENKQEGVLGSSLTG